MGLVEKIQVEARRKGLATERSTLLMTPVLDNFAFSS